MLLYAPSEELKAHFLAQWTAVVTYEANGVLDQKTSQASLGNGTSLISITNTVALQRALQDYV